MKAKHLIPAAVFMLVAALCFSAPLNAQTPPAAQPNTGTHFEFTAGYDINGDASNQATVVGVRVPFTSRWSGVFTTTVAPNSGPNGLEIYLAGAEYRRNLSDLIKAKSEQVNPGRFEIWGTFKIGHAVDAIAKGNSSFAWAAGGALTLKLSETDSVDVLRYEYVRARHVEGGLLLRGTNTLAVTYNRRF